MSRASRTTITTEPVKRKQLPMLIRLIWFVVFGWWLGLIWFAFCLTFTLLGGFLVWPITSKFWNLLPTLVWLEMR